MLTSALSRLGGIAARRPWRVITVWLFVVIASVGAAVTAGGTTTDTMSAPGLDSQQATDLLQRAGWDGAGLTAQVVATPKDGTSSFFDSDSGPAKEALAAVQAEVEALPRVLGTSDPAGALASGRDTAVRSGFISPDGRVAVLRVQYPELKDLTAVDLDNLLAVSQRQPADSPLRIEMGGDLFFAFADAGGNTGELIGIIVAAAILFLAFGSLVATALPLGMAAFGLAVGMSTITLLARVTEISSFATAVGSMVGIGVGIDYALFVLARHREYLADGVEVHEAAGRAVATAGRPVVFAGGTVIVSVLGMAVAGVPFLTAGGLAISFVVLVMVLASVTLLPAFLGLAGRRINRFGPRRLMASGTAADGRWHRWIGHVNRHPVVYALTATGLLLAAAAPALALRVGIPDDGALPPHRTERQAYDLVAEGFGPGTNGPLLVVVDTAGDPTVADRLAEAVTDDAGIASVLPPRLDEGSGIASLVAIPTTGPQDEAATDTIARLRGSVLPSATAGSPAQAHVGGGAASFVDVGQRLFDRLPLFVAAVLALSFILLLLVFRSVLVPLKAVLVNLLSISASYGVMVMVFQWGWAASLIGLEATVPIVSFIPMIMFAILFGLSMDYEVFLLSRVREEYLRGCDNGVAIVRGISGTARIITSAAMIMVAVFLSFVFGEDAPSKTLGLGLATAIFVDATVVRTVLVPATMTMLGRANWWLPRWLDRVLPHVSVEPHVTVEAPGRDAEAGDPAADSGPDRRTHPDPVPTGR